MPSVDIPEVEPVNAFNFQGRGLALGGAQRVGRRQISRCDNFYEMYVRRQDALQSSQKSFEVFFAERKHDGIQMVVKLRHKTYDDAEVAWRDKMEFVLNLPDSCGIALPHEVLEDDKAFYIVSMRAPGSDLHESIRSKGEFSIEEARDIIYYLLEAVRFLHQCGAVHRDLKLENIVLDLESLRYCASAQNTALSNRGLAEQRAASKPESSSQPAISSQLPAASDCSPQLLPLKIVDLDTVEEFGPGCPLARFVCGTDQYTSPEAYSGKYSPQTDIFAVGVVAFRLVTGKFPFPDDVFTDEPGENWVGSPKMLQVRCRLKAVKVDFKQPVFQRHPDARDLLQRMISMNPQERPLAHEALQHPWLGRGKGKFAGSPKSQAWAMRRSLTVDSSRKMGTGFSFTKFLGHMKWGPKGPGT